MPVDAPLGTAARNMPLCVYRSTSTVGFPRESRISRAWILSTAMVTLQLSLCTWEDASPNLCREQGFKPEITQSHHSGEIPPFPFHFPAFSNRFHLPLHANFAQLVPCRDASGVAAGPGPPAGSLLHLSTDSPSAPGPAAWGAPAVLPLPASY